MQPNLSNSERMASMAVGSAALIYGFMGNGSASKHLEKAAGFALFLRGLSGYCPLYRAFNRKPLHAPHDIERSIVIDRSVEELRSMLDEGDPLFHESSRKIFPITAGYLLWDLELEPIGDGRMTHVKATLSEHNEPFELKTYLSRNVLKSMADSELSRIKELLESGVHA